MSGALFVTGALALLVIIVIAILVLPNGVLGSRLGKTWRAWVPKSAKA